VSSTQRLIKPYALPMLRVLLLKANDVNPSVVANVLMCVGELVCISGEDAIPYVSELLKVIIERLSDASVGKRDAALHALGQVCSSTGHVIAPLIDYPQLVPLLSRILRMEATKNVRREVVRVLGILGALDPYRRKVCYSLFQGFFCELILHWFRVGQMMMPSVKRQSRLLIKSQLPSTMQCLELMIIFKLSSSIRF